MNRNGKKQIKGNRRGMLSALALFLFLLTGLAGAGAYRLSGIKAPARLKVMHYGLSTEIDEAKTEQLNDLFPGEERSIVFKVKNTGDVSVDVQPVITLESPDRPMEKDRSFILKGAGDREIYTAVYYRDGVLLEESGGTLWDRAVFTLSGSDILSGKLQKDGRGAGEAQDADAGSADAEKEYCCLLAMHPQASNALMGAALNITIETRASQYRREERSV